MAGKTHWKKLNNPDYLGAYALEPGEDKIVTIREVKKENVVGADGKKEECIVMHLEGCKPMILNSTNAKTIEKLYKTPYIEEWRGRRIQLYIEKVRAFGDVVDALRIRKKIPASEVMQTVCADCGKKIEAYQSHTAEGLARYTYQKYGKPLCADCAGKLAEKMQGPKDVLGGGEDASEK